MSYEPHIRKLGEAVDQMISIEMTGRGVIGDLYAEARRIQGEPLCLLAARKLTEVVRQRDVVVIATGLPTFPWNVGEQDGPVGAATLARALVLGFGAKPLIVTDPGIVQVCHGSLIGAGINSLSLEQMRRFPTTGHVMGFPIDWDEAREQARWIVDELKPKAIITIERPGANEHGRYHSASGRDLSHACAKIDVLLDLAKERGVLTIGIGDGGNEIGCAMIKEKVCEVVPVSRVCNCGCGGSVVPAFETDVLVAAAISNWGAYGIEACLAALLKQPELLHDKDVDLRVHWNAANAGANNNGPGLLDIGTDYVPGPVHGAFLEVLGHMVRANADPGRLYRVPRYPWLYYQEDDAK